MLPVKKIYVDTKNKTTDSISNSQFKWELPETISLPHNTIFFVDDISIPHSWYTINQNMNDRIYMQVTDIQVLNPIFSGPKPNECRIITLTPGHYNLQQLSAEIATKANAAFANPNLATHFSTSPNNTNNTITITPLDASLMVKVLTDNDLKTGMADVSFYGWSGAWNGPTYDTSNPLDIHDIINNTEGSSSFFSQASPFTTGYVDLQPIKNIYMSSPNLGSFHTFGPTNQRTIIKKIPVNAGNNEMIFNSVTSGNDWLDCSRQTLKTLQFELKDAKGNVGPLNGSHVSFSLVFDKYNEEQ